VLTVQLHRAADAIAWALIRGCWFNARMLKRGRLLAVAVVLLFAGPAGAANAATITAKASKSEIQYRGSLKISGSVKEGNAAVLARPVELQAKSAGSSKFSHVADGDTGTTGTYSFPGLTPDRNTAYRVVSEPDPPATVRVTVNEIIHWNLKALPLGRMRLTVMSQHPKDLQWGGQRAYVFVAQGRRFELVAKPRTSKSGPTTKVTASFPVEKAGRFRFAECFKAPDARAMGAADKHGFCHTRSFVPNPHKQRRKSITTFEGSGFAPPGYPSLARVKAAARYQSHRSGRTAFAVVDSQGRLSGRHMHRTFVTASVVKAMLLVAYLRKLDAAHRPLDSSSRARLHPMIHVSDNSAATSVWRSVGNKRLYRLARKAGMTEFSIVGIWARAQISPADQARFFFKQDALIPRQFRGYARSLLSHISGAQSWGIPHVARPDGWHVFFKGGWRGTGLGQLVHQVGRLEKHHTKFAMAVMTDGDPSMGYGITTIQGVTAKLIAKPLPKASKVIDLGPGGG
jgi:beta-lactamase family protein